MTNLDIASIIYPLIIFSIIIALFAYIIFIILRARGQVWTGTIIHKTREEVEDGGITKTIYYSLKIRSDDGREFIMAIDKANFNKYKKGDRLKKKAGELWPNKI